MQRWIAPEPLPLAIDVARLARIDLEFTDVRRDNGSLTFLVFLNSDDVPLDADRDHPNFAAGYTVFAQSSCWGGHGHCDWERGPVSHFDRRPEHHLRPFDLTLEVTSAVRRLGNPEALQVTVHAARLDDWDAEDVFRFRRLTAVAYQ